MIAVLLIVAALLLYWHKRRQYHREWHDLIHSRYAGNAHRVLDLAHWEGETWLRRRWYYLLRVHPEFETYDWRGTRVIRIHNRGWRA